MGKYLVQIPDPDGVAEPLIVNWSEVVDAPVSKPGTRAQWAEWLEDEVSQLALAFEWSERRELLEIDEAMDRLTRLDVSGTSTLHGLTWEEAILCNRAGHEETWLTHRQLWELLFAQWERDPC